MLAPAFRNHYREVPVLKTVATQKEGISELMDHIFHLLKMTHLNDKRFWLLAEKAFYLIERKRMRGIDKTELKKEIEKIYPKGNFNLYKFIADR